MTTRDDQSLTKEERHCWEDNWPETRFPAGSEHEDCRLGWNVIVVKDKDFLKVDKLWGTAIQRGGGSLFIQRLTRTVLAAPSCQAGMPEGVRRPFPGPCPLSLSKGHGWVGHITSSQTCWKMCACSPSVHGLWVPSAAPLTGPAPPVGGTPPVSGQGWHCGLSASALTLLLGKFLSPPLAAALSSR